MGSDLYDVRALSRTANTLVLEVQVVHPDAMQIPADRSFALMMLRDTAEKGDALYREVAFEHTLDEVWVEQYAAGFISDVQVTDVTGEPPKEALEGSHHDYWDHPDGWMRGRLHVTVTDPAWIAHIRPGATWPSRAFQLVGSDSYEEHAPILPGGAAGPAEVEGAFVWVPRDTVIELAPPDIPALFEVPAYAPTAYAVVQVMKRGAIDTERLRAWIGKPVCVEGDYGEHVGALVAIAGSTTAVVASCQEGSYGVNQIEPVSIGLLKPVAGRRGAKLGYDDILRLTQITAVSAVKRGATLEVRLRIPPDGRSLPVRTETDVLGLLFAPLKYKGWEPGAPSLYHQHFRPSALSRALEQDLAARDMEGAHRVEEILPEIAKRYVASFVIDPPAATPLPRLGTMTHAEAREALAAPWPTATLRVQVSDEKWLEHFDLRTPLIVRQSPLPAPREPQPRPAPVAPAPPDDRAVLWTGDKIWMAERRGATWTARWGKRSNSSRHTKDHAAASVEKAKAAFDKAVTAKVEDGYRRAPATAAAAAIVKLRLGLALDDTSGKVVVTMAGPPCENVDVMGELWCRRGDEVVGIMPVETRDDTRVTVIEEVAIAIEPVAPGEQIYVHCNRPSSRSGSSPLVNIR
jgi:hypothetical protein